MPIEYSFLRDDSVAVAHCFGELTEADVVAAVKHGGEDQRLAACRRRIVTIDPAARDVHVTGRVFRSPLELPVVWDA